MKIFSFFKNIVLLLICNKIINWSLKCSVSVLPNYNMRGEITMFSFLKMFSKNEVNLGIVKYKYKGKKHQW